MRAEGPTGARPRGGSTRLARWALLAACLVIPAVPGCLCSDGSTIEDGKTKNGKTIGDPIEFLEGKWNGEGVAEAPGEKTDVLAGFVKLTQLEFTLHDMHVVHKARPEKSYTQSFKVVKVDGSTIHVDTKRDGRQISPTRIVAVDEGTIWVRHSHDVAFGVYKRMPKSE